MKRTITILAVAAAIPALAGCGDRSGGNAAAEQNNIQQADEVSSNDLQNIGSSAPLDNLIAPTAPARPSPTAVPQPREEPPAPSDASSGTDDARRPPPRAPRPQPEPDPHAGHDMGNMANMSRD